MALAARHQKVSSIQQGRTAKPAVSRVSCQAQRDQHDSVDRRNALAQTLAVLGAALYGGSGPVWASSLPEQTSKVLCEASCASEVEKKEKKSLKSGLQYVDIVEGKGPLAPAGYQVTVNYVAMTPAGRVFDSSLDKGQPYDIRVGAGQVIPGLDEGLKTMRVGGIRRLYVPGNLAFPNGVKAVAGRPSVPPNSPVIFDVQLLYIPGLEYDE